MPVGDDVDDSQGSEPWTCPRCGRNNKAIWSQCPACESDRAGLLPLEREPATPKPRNNPIHLALGLLVLVALVLGVLWIAGPLWDWAVDQWNTFVTWVQART